MINLCLLQRLIIWYGLPRPREALNVRNNDDLVIWSLSDVLIFRQIIKVSERC
jgi:hypothetical protein